MYTNEKLWSCMVGYNLTKLIPSWYEAFMICNDAFNTWAFLIMMWCIAYDVNHDLKCYELLLKWCIINVDLMSWIL